jgi:hypothetical protein
MMIRFGRAGKTQGGGMMKEKARMTRRLAGYLGKRLSEAGLARVEDPRNKRGRRWKLGALLVAMLAGMMAGSKGLSEVEELTERLSRPIGRLLGIVRRVADTTMRDLLVKLEPAGLRCMLYRVVKAAQRRKALQPDVFPFGVVSMDGRGTSTRYFDEKYAQVERPRDQMPFGVVRTITSALVSTPARPCIDAHPIPADTNEMGAFPAAFEALLRAYGRSLFSVVMYDSGANSKANAQFITDRGLDYVFRLQKEQPTLLEEAERLLERLGAAKAAAESVELSGGKMVTRRIWLTDEIAAFHDWEHLKVAVRIQTVAEHKTSGHVSVEDRYYTSSLTAGVLTADQWLEMIRRRWSVENESHNTWDRIFREDDRPWVYDPQGMVSAMLMRRIAYTLLALFRRVTQRSDARRAVPWKTLLHDLRDTLISAQQQHLEDLPIRRIDMAVA